MSWPPRFLLPGAELTARVLLGAAVLVPLIVLWNYGARGDAHRAAVIVLGGVAALLLAWHRMQSPQPDDVPARGDRWVVAPFAVALLAAAGSLLPLPRGALELLAPETARIYGLDEAAAGLSQAAARPLSLEPIATWRSGLLGAAYLAFLLMLAPVARRATLARRLALALAAVGVLAAFMSLWGLAEKGGPPQFRGRPVFPLVNPNHLCTLLVAALGLALGAMLVPIERSEASAHAHEIPAAVAASDPLSSIRRALGRRGFAGVLAGLLVIGILGTRSRAGALAAALTAALAFLIRLGPGRRLAAAGAVLVLGGGLLLGDLDSLKARFAEEEPRLDSLGGRVENWSVALRVIDGRRLGGSGLGAFRDASVAAVTSERAGNTRPGEAHDDYLELMAAIGIPLGALAIIALGGVVALALRRTRAAPPRARAVAQGALAATAGVLVHALFDFALQIPAPALLALGALGLCFFAPHDDEEEKRARATKPARMLARVAAPLVLGVFLLASGLPLLIRTQAESAARLAFEQAARRDDRVKAEVFRRVERELRAIDGPGARADMATLRVRALEVAHEHGWESAAEQAARAAVARAPGRAETHADLGHLLHHLWRSLPAARRQEPAAARLLAEYEARIDLALELAPNSPAILVSAGECALERLIRTGHPAQAERALALFRAGIRRDPAQQAIARRVIEARAAVLGEQGERLVRALEPAQ